MRQREYEGIQYHISRGAEFGILVGGGFLRWNLVRSFRGIKQFPEYFDSLKQPALLWAHGNFKEGQWVFTDGVNVPVQDWIDQWDGVFSRC